MNTLLIHGKSSPEVYGNASKNFAYIWKIIGLLIIGSLIFIASCKVAFAEVNESQAIRAIIGEADSQDFIGMVAVGEVIRKRGSLKGIHGYINVKERYGNVSPKIKSLARKAWRRSKYTNVTKGADHFDNIKEFGYPYWAKKCKETFRYRDQVFYKENGA